MQHARGHVVREELLATPVRSARAWTTALAPNRRGGWNFITQLYSVGTEELPEFVVVDLDTGKSTTTPGLSGIYANSNYQIAEQLRAPNGRIFFPQVGNHLAYYDPESEQVKQLGRIVTTDEDKALYRLVFGPDGKLYGGTQSNGLPTIFVVDPETLQYRVLGKVGTNRRGYSYAYYLAVEPPWVYVVVGQDPWELVAFDTRTNTSKVLTSRPADGFMQFEMRENNIRVKLVSKLRSAEQQTILMWCVDGALVSSVGQLARRPVARLVNNALVGAPELDLRGVQPDHAGVGRLRWRSRGARRWQETAFRTLRPDAIPIDSLAALPDGTLFGSTKQYHGFFRFDPATRKLERHEGIRISGGPRVVVGKLVYFAGYPNSVLYVYDPSRPWNPQATSPNPLRLGNFEEAGAHYPYFLVPSRDGRLYFAGRRERTGQGGAIGYYDPRTGRFAGNHDQLDEITPRGLVVLDELGRIVFSGRADTGPEAQLVVFDRELHELERVRVIPGMKSTGLLFATAERGVFVGISAEDRIAYRFDLAARKLLGTRKLPGPLGPATRRSSDGSIWLLAGRSLARLDPKTLALQLVGEVATPTADGFLVWQGDRLYRASGSDLYEIVLAE